MKRISSLFLSNLERIAVAQVYKTVHTTEIEMAKNSKVDVKSDYPRDGRYKIHFSGPGLDLIIRVSEEQIIDLFSSLTVLEQRMSKARSQQKQAV
jgi:hypothetical protein